MSKHEIDSKNSSQNDPAKQSVDPKGGPSGEISMPTGTISTNASDAPSPEIIDGELDVDQPGATITTTLQATSVSHSGPLPPPSVLAEYSKIDPTLPTRIVEMAERSQKHMIEIRSRSLALDEFEAKARNSFKSRGQLLCTFFVVPILVAGVVFTAHWGARGASTALAVAIVGILGVLVLGAVRSDRPDSSSDE